MARVYARDIETAIITKLKNVTTGINSILQTIDTERSETLYNESKIIDNNIQPVDFNNQVPSIHVFVKQMNRDNGGGIGETSETMTAFYTVSIDILTKFNKPSKAIKILNNYEEALIRCLHLQNLTGITQILVKSAQKSSISNKNDMMYFDILESEWMIRIN